MWQFTKRSIPLGGPGDEAAMTDVLGLSPSDFATTSTDSSLRAVVDELEVDDVAVGQAVPCRGLPVVRAVVHQQVGPDPADVLPRSGQLIPRVGLREPAGSPELFAKKQDPLRSPEKGRPPIALERAQCFESYTD